MIKELGTKFNIRKLQVIYLFLLFLVYILSFAIVLKPSLSGIVDFKIANVEFVLLAIYSVYPFYILSLILLMTKFKEEFSTKVIVVMSLFFGVLVILLNFGLMAVEANNFPNFIYSKYHIFLPYLNHFSNIQIFIVIVSLLIIPGKVSLFSRIEKNASIKNISSMSKSPIYLVVLLLAVMITGYLPSYVNLAIYETKMTIRSQKNEISFDLRTVDLWDVADKMNFVVKKTEKDSIILIPPQTWDFPEVGNQVLARYYLYPRTLVSPKKVVEFSKALVENKSCNIYYLLSEKGRFNGEYFPETDVFVKKISLRFKDGKETDFTDVSFDKKFRDSLKNLEIGVMLLPKCRI